MACKLTRILVAALAVTSCKGEEVGVAGGGGGNNDASTENDPGGASEDGALGGASAGGESSGGGTATGGTSSEGGTPAGGAPANGGTATGGALPTGGTVGTGGGSATGGGCSADLKTSSANCGRCGHNCGVGATCKDGLCTPITVINLTGALPTQASIRLDGSRFYYHQFDSTVGYFVPTSVGFFSTAGGATTTLSGSEERAGYALSQYTWDKPLAVDEAYAYWFDYLSGDQAHLNLRRAPKDGTGMASSLVLLALSTSSNQGPVGMAVDAEYVYWIQENNGLYRYPKAGGASQPELLQALPGESTDTMVLDRGSLYWASTINGQIWRYPVSGGAPPSFIDAPSGAIVCGLALDGDTLFWGQCSAPYDVHRVGIDATGSQLLASPMTDAGIVSTAQGGVVVDQNYAYFVGSHYVHRVPKGGGQEEAIGYTQAGTGSDQYDHRLIGVDAAYVYLLNFAEYSVQRLAK